jgi:type IV pilus assembly protein PilC
VGIKIEQVRKSELLQNSVVKEKGAKSVMDFLNMDFSFSKGLSDKKKFRFYKDLSLLISAGIDLRMSLELAAEGEKHKRTKSIIEKVYANIISGSTFSNALEQTGKFSQYEFISVKIGEESGTLPTILNDLAVYYEGRVEFKRKMLSTFSYPVIVLLTAALAVVFMLTFIVPIFEDAFKRFGGELPYLTQKVLGLSDFLQAYGSVVFIGLMSICLVLYSQRNKEWFRKYFAIVLLKTPIIGEIAKKTYLSRFCHSMSLLIRVNNPLVGSINLVSKMVRFYPLETALAEMEQDILKGALLYESMKKHRIFPNRMISLIKVAEEVNKLATVFEQIQIQYESETENSSKTIGSLLEPFLIIFIGFFVGTILVAMYLPLFELGSGIQ